MENPDHVTLIVSGKRFNCSKSCLVERSSYFRAMFTNTFVERDKQEVQIIDVDPEGLGPLLQPNFDYTICEDPLNILEVACMLQFDGAIESCINYIKEIWMSSRNCLRTFLTAKRLCLKELMSKAKLVALCEFNQVKTNDEYLYMPMEDLFSYLDDNTLNARTGEYEVFIVIKRWICYNNISDGNKIFSLLSTLRLKDLSITELMQIRAHNFITCKALSLIKYAIGQVDVKTKKKAPTSRRPIQYSSQSIHVTRSKVIDYEVTSRANEILSKLRQLGTTPCLVASQCSIVIEDNDDGDWEENEPHLYAWNGHSLVPVLNLDKIALPDVAIGCRVVCIDLTVYTVGGEFMARPQGAWNMAIWAYEFPLARWRHETDLPIQRRHHSVCNVDNDIYLIGGVGKHRIILKTISKYNVVSKTWSECIGLPRAIHSAACCVHEGNIYIIDLDVVIYKPKENRTETMSVVLPEKIGIRCAMSYKSWIYLVGSTVPKIYKFEPLGRNPKIQHVGTFSLPGNNACISNGMMYHFSEAEEMMYIECFDLTTSSCKVIYCKSTGDTGMTFDLSAGCFPLLNYILERN